MCLKLSSVILTYFFKIVFVFAMFLIDFVNSWQLIMCMYTHVVFLALPNPVGSAS